ncbi:MAG: hypothetical protein PW845_03415 [Pseudomonas sp.]|uniref:hypothetical protein n=1 Tax=Pseudomonas abieticivorans TaxID=2931382 RepID=UPI0020BFD113|nr:hypothetical protein [Pseudomonas sp. PIA16]MDE1164441.1 hypothetical protein [Pseudomonas sp.]
MLTTPGADPHQALRSAWVLFAIGVLYVSFGVCFGLLEYGIPPILMSRGVDLASMGWVIALYIPFGLTFLWAPVIDGKRLPWLSQRIGWIAASQCVSSLLLLVVAFGEGLPAIGLFALGLAICFAVATMDLALDALAVDIIGAHFRALAAGLKVAALALGGLIGGGVLVARFDSLGWTGTFVLTAGLPLLTLLPVLALTRADHPRQAQSLRPSIWVTLRRPGAMRQIALLSLTTSATISLVYFQRPILVQMGVPLAQIGWGLGTLAPLVNTVAAVLTAPALTLMAPLKSLALLVLLSAIAAGGTVFGLAKGLSDGVMLWALIQGAASSALSVIIYSLILKWSAREQSATDYAVLCGSSRMLTTLILMAVAPALAYFSWGVFYALCVVVLALLAFLIRREVQGLDEALP